MISLGVLAALCALVGWGTGDFLIQKIVRKVGSFHLLFCNGIIGLCITLPLAWPHLGALRELTHEYYLLAGITVGVLVNAFFSFEAFRKGKIAVVSPVLALELPLTVVLAVLIAGDRPTILQLSFIALIVFGFLLVSRYINGGTKVEKGVTTALFGVSGLAVYNLTVGLVSRTLHPTLTALIVNIFILLLSFALLVHRHEAKPKQLFAPFKIFPWMLPIESLLITGASLCFAYATTMLPISIATGVSEGYVALSVLLGLFIGKEKLKKSQLWGVAAVIIGITALAFMAS